MSKAIHSDTYIPKLDNVVDFEQFSVTMSRPSVEVVSSREFATQAEHEAFMSDRVVIEINPTSDRNAPDLVPVGLNGKQSYLPRGQKISVPRGVVEILARSMEVHFKSLANQDQSSLSGTVQKRTVTQPYTFSVLQDPSPKGRAWLERVTREQN